MDQRFWLHPEYASIMETIRANPEDIAPRMVLADWIEDHDDGPWQGRPLYIRERCEPNNPLWLKQTQGFYPSWNPMWPDHPNPPPPIGSISVKLGWISEVWCKGEDFADIMGVTAVAHPLEVVHLSSPPPWLKQDRLGFSSIWDDTADYHLRGRHCEFAKTHRVVRELDLNFYAAGGFAVFDHWNAEIARDKCALHHEYAPMEDSRNRDYFFWLRKNTDIS